MIGYKSNALRARNVPVNKIIKKSRDIHVHQHTLDKYIDIVCCRYIVPQ